MLEIKTKQAFNKFRRAHRKTGNRFTGVYERSGERLIALFKGGVKVDVTEAFN